MTSTSIEDSAISEKVSSSSEIERRKVKLEKSMEQDELDTSECDRNEQQDQEPESCTSKRMILEQWIGSRARKTRVPNLFLGKRFPPSRGGQNISRADASEEVEEGVGESCFSCPKRQRVEFDSKQQHYSFNAELGHDLHGTSVPKDGRQSMSRLSMEFNEEYGDDVNGKGSQLKAETDAQHNACFVCMLGGQLLFCVGEGCKNCYHLYCLDPPLKNDPPGVWHCIWCVKKKIELGVHSVSQEVESIWDARELVSDYKVMQSEKQYLVKYQGLAHVHNRWISETELLIEAPKLVAKFNKKNQHIRWKTEWTVPHRLLQKRKLSFPKHYDGYHSDGDDDNTLNGHYEWLVKWTGLGYDHATWEIESLSFLTSPEAMKLMKDYESRHEKAEKLSQISEADKEGNGNFSELSELSFGDSPEVYNRYLSYVNKLRKYWHKGQNAVVVDQADQERIVKVILFILSLQFVVWKPFLIISTSTALSLWEDEFLHVAPSANVVMYKGEKAVRSSIRSLEFYNEGGHIMFQVLLSSSDAVVEDLEVLECIQWEAIIIDECQRSRMSRHLRKIKMLITNMRLLLFSSQIKDCSADYHRVLSLLDSGHDGLNSDNTEVDSDTDLDKLRKQLARYIAFECKSGPSRFIEYWVPVQLSDLQLEQYCATLLSNSMLLCSLKNDPADDALRQIIFSTRKCCDHPYLLDQSLQSIVTKGLPIKEYLDVGIKVSGKLKLLDKILLEMKSRGLRVIILFQSIGDSGWDSVGNILDDFVCQRFGKDSYVRIDGRGYVRSKKQAALNMFNDKDSGRFVFLIEDRACLPSVKLSSVDTVILFDSAYDPQNDLKALHRITIGSQFEQIKVFRLYSTCTVEEKVLILAKEGVTLDGNIRSLNRNTCHTLLNWGASYLFQKLDDFHGCKMSVSGSNISSEQLFLNDVFCELLTQLPSSGNNDPSSCSIISKVQQNGVYTRNILLLGEKKRHLVDNEEPPFFWTNLLQGRHPQWKFLSELSPRARRKVQCIDKSPKESKFEDDAVIKKSRKVVNNTVDPVYLNSKLKGKRKLVPVDKEDKLAGGRGDLNQGTQFSLKPEISQLCEILQLPENIKAIAVSFLEYVMKDYNVSWEEESTRQAFQISVCWTAASLLNCEINYKESLALAKLHLNFHCKEEEADYIYSKLQNIKKVFARCSENLECVKKSNNAKTSRFTSSNKQDLEGEEMPLGFQSHNYSNQGVPATTEQATGFRGKEKNDISSSITEVQEICSKRMGKLLSKLPVGKEYELAGGRGDLNQSTQFSLKPEISQLCEILQLPENIKATAVSFLEYVMKDYNVNWEEESTRQAFQISVCWTAASLMNCEINYKESLALAKLHLNFHCKEEEADHIYSKLQNVKKVFARWSENVEGVKESYNAKTSKFTSSDQQGLEGEEMPLGLQSHNFSNHGISATMEQATGFRGEEKKDISSSIREVQEIFGKRMENLLSKQQNENKKFNRKVTEERAKLEEAHRLESALIHTRESDITVRLDKLKILDHNYKEKKDEHNHQMAIHWKILEASQLASRIDEEQLKTNWSVQLEKSKSGTIVSSLVNLCLPDSNFNVDKMQPSNTAGIDIDPIQLENSKAESPVSPLGNLCSPDNEFKLEKSRPGNTAGIDADSHAVPNAISSSPKQTETGSVQSVPSEVSDLSLNEKTFCSLSMETLFSERETAACREQHDKAGSTSDGVEVSGPPEWQSPVRNEQTIQSIVRPSEVPQTVPNEVIMCNDAMRPNKVSSGIDDVSLERATVSKVEQHNKVATPVCGESPTLEVTGTNSSMVQPNINNIQRNLFLTQQLPISINPSSTEHILPTIPVFKGIQHHQSSARHAPSQEAQVPTQPLEVPVELFERSVLHSIRQLQLQRSTCMPVGGIETHVRDLPSTTTLQGMKDHILQANLVTPEMPQHVCSDPLQYEMEKIQKGKEQAFKMHEDKMLQLKYECDKEIEEIHMKYEMLLQDAETALLQKKKDFDTYYKMVFVNKLLAEALTLKQDNYKAAGSSEIASSFISQLIQQTSSMSGPRHEQILASTPAAPPLHVISNLSARPSTSPGPPGRPLSRPIIHFPGNLQDGSVLRAPGPHLASILAYMSTPYVPTMCSGMPNQQLLSNLPTPVMQNQLAPRPSTESDSILLPECEGLPDFHSSQSDHTGTTLQGQLSLHDFRSYITPAQSGQAVTSTSGFPPVSVGAATDLVCVSDDD